MPPHWYLRREVQLGALLLAPVVLCALAAFSASALSQKVYASQVDLLFQALEDPDISEQFRATQTVIVTGRPVLGAVAAALQTTVPELGENLKVSFPKGSAVMQIQYADPDGDRALETLNAILDRYLAVLDQTAEANAAGHRLLAPPYVLEDPVRPRPLEAAALGLSLGLVISMGGFAFFQRRRSAP